MIDDNYVLALSREKLAYYTGNEKTAAIPPGAIRIVNGTINNGVGYGLAGGMLGAGIGLTNSLIKDYGTENFTPLEDTLRGSLVGLGVGGLGGGLYGAADGYLLQKLIKNGVGI